MKVSWPSNQQSFATPLGGAVFPIPPIPTPGVGCGSSVKAKRRRGRKTHGKAQANYTISCLNELYGCQPGLAVTGDQDGSLSPCHASIHARLESIFSTDEFRLVQCPRAAARLLLGSRCEYGGSDTTVEAYDSHRVSLPSGRVCPVPLRSVLPERIQSLLTPDNILADDDVVEERMRNEHVTCYTDEVLKRDPEALKGFLVSLANCGVLIASCNPRGRVTPFFVKKKNGKQRLVLDCRVVNAMFRRPFKPEIVAAEAIKE